MITRWLTALAIVGAALAVVAPTALAKDSDERTERGIVQAVAPRKLAIRVLDGSTVALAVDGRAKVSIDGRKAALLAVRPGFVVVVTVTDGVARDVKAYDPAKTVTVPSGDKDKRGGTTTTIPRDEGKRAGTTTTVLKDETEQPKPGRSRTR